MIDYLERLALLLPPPAVPVARPPWERSQAKVGFEFPSDYRAFVDRYGGGFAGTPDSLRSFVYAPSSVPLAPGRTSGFGGFVDWHASEIAPLSTGWDEDEWGGTAYPCTPSRAVCSRGARTRPVTCTAG